jgi:hypothetical protein
MNKTSGSSRSKVLYERRRVGQNTKNVGEREKGGGGAQKKKVCGN